MMKEPGIKPLDLGPSFFPHLIEIVWINSLTAKKSGA